MIEEELKAVLEGIGFILLSTSDRTVRNVYWSNGSWWYSLDRKNYNRIDKDVIMKWKKKRIGDVKKMTHKDGKQPQKDIGVEELL